MCGPESIDANGVVMLDGATPAYRIVDHERLPPFLMTVVSAWDHWMFVSSTGGLAAGRVEPGRGLFPYETDDRLHRVRGVTGPLTVIRVRDGDGAVHLWEPFDRRRDESVRRHLVKTLAGDALELVEEHPGLGLTFRYRWCTSEPYGFVRRCTLERHPGRGAVDLEILDGLLNLMPPQVELSLQQSSSCLVDAYKMAERDPASSLGTFSLTSRIVDRAEPSEALRGTVAWCQGLEPRAVLLSDEQVEAFRRGATVNSEAQILGRRFAYLVAAELHLDDGASHCWRLCGDVHRSASTIVALRQELRDTPSETLAARIDASVAAGRERLVGLVASADGLRRTGDLIGDAHHYANVLFNIMRGGVFVDDHQVSRQDFARFLKQRNTAAYARHAGDLATLAATIPHDALRAWASDTGDAALLRLAHEYLPLTFSRRHGDPSRPWNRFSIRVLDEHDEPDLHYEGNWRDIFQNWEALLWSYPGFIEPVVAKFVNASTADGFNPYRITREGIDWEEPDPEDPWSNIGYWGDHQTIYLLKLLEASQRFHPAALEALLEAPIFSYADVPYRIVPYAELVVDPHDTIRFDGVRNRAIAERVATLGADGKLLADADGVVHVTLVEKLLVCALARLSNLVPDGGIWMNTQRPEWNDANNALVGHGLSMVTLCYLRRFMRFFGALLAGKRGQDVPLSAAVGRWLDQVAAALTDEASALAAPRIDDILRKRVMDRLGQAFSAYRTDLYATGLGAPEPRSYDALLDLAETSSQWLDHAIEANRRSDGLYHAYNLVEIRPDGVGIDHLYEMLEGQVAVLSSGALDASQSLEVVDALFASAMYREDQQSFTLYPDRPLPGLLDRGVVPEAWVQSNPLLTALLESHPRPLVERDASGRYRFASDLRNAAVLGEALDELAADAPWADLVEAHRADTLELYEDIFEHRAFTGRSGTMVAYEGLGSIYWHMVSKLLLAVQETFLRAAEAERDETDRLRKAYLRIRDGLSAAKSPAEYGAFPTDPYSHTPGHRGAQQPGMTGQVKEEVLTHWGELGVEVNDGVVHFRPRLAEIGPEGCDFTLCGVPITYRRGDAAQVRVRLQDDERTFDGDALDPRTSARLFARDGTVTRVVVTLPT